MEKASNNRNWLRYRMGGNSKSTNEKLIKGVESRGGFYFDISI
jgi:hypothetical protein